MFGIVFGGAAVRKNALHADPVGRRIILKWFQNLSKIIPPMRQQLGNERAGASSVRPAPPEDRQHRAGQGMMQTLKASNRWLAEVNVVSEWLAPRIEGNRKGRV